MSTIESHINREEFSQGCKGGKTDRSYYCAFIVPCSIRRASRVDLELTQMIAENRIFTSLESLQTAVLEEVAYLQVDCKRIRCFLAKKKLPSSQTNSRVYITSSLTNLNRIAVYSLFSSTTLAS